MPVFLIFFCVTGKIYGATLCDADVEVLIDGIPIEKNVFNVTFSFTNISKENVFHLVPSWDKLTVLQDTVLVDKSDNISVSMIAEYFYLYQVQLSCVNSQQEEEAVLFDIPVGRTVIDSLLANIFQKLIFAGVIFTMFLLGCELNLETVRSYLAHPVGPVAGMVCQYVVMPVAAYVWGYIFLNDSLYARYGLIIVGCSPGGTFSNFYTAIWNGDVNLSVTMTFCSSVASFACTTFWIWLFGTFVLSADRDIQLPYLQLFLSLVSFVVPILLGLLLTYKKPTLGAKLAKIFHFCHLLAAFCCPCLPWLLRIHHRHHHRQHPLPQQAPDNRPVYRNGNAECEHSGGCAAVQPCIPIQ